MYIDILFPQVKSQISPHQRFAHISVAKSWARGRTLYGGISASLVYYAARQLVDTNKHQRALNTSFIGQ